MNGSALYQGQNLDSIFAPLSDDGYASGGAVGRDGITSITVSQCAGPSGFFDVAVIERGGQSPAVIVPIHMAEMITLSE